MNLESDKRLNIQLRLDFSSAPTGEARQAGGEDIESLSVTNEPERPADTRQSCQRNFSNRRVRTRTHGGVGGAEPRGSPLSRSVAQSGPSAKYRRLLSAPLTDACAGATGQFS